MSSSKISHERERKNEGGVKSYKGSTYNEEY